MKTTDIDALRASWKQEKAFNKKILNPEEIRSFMRKRSGRMTRLYKSGLAADITYKSMVLAAMIIFLVLVPGPGIRLVVPVCILALAAILGILHQIRVYRKIPRSAHAVPVIRESLEEKIRFFHSDFIPAIYVSALSNPLLVISGFLYYFYFKYGTIRPFAWDDYLVFGTAVLLSYVLMAWPLRKQYRFQVKQVESCLEDIDGEELNELKLKDQRNQRLRFIMAMVIALILGILLFNYFLARSVY